MIHLLLNKKFCLIPRFWDLFVLMHFIPKHHYFYTMKYISEDSKQIEFVSRERKRVALTCIHISIERAIDYNLLCNLLNFSFCIIILISVLILTIKMIHSKWEKEFILKTLTKKRQSDYRIVLSLHLFLCYIMRCWKVLSLTNFLKFNQVTKYLNNIFFLNSSLLGQELLSLFFVLIVLWGWWIPEDLGDKKKKFNKITWSWW